MDRGQRPAPREGASWRASQACRRAWWICSSAGWTGRRQARTDRAGRSGRS